MPHLTAHQIAKAKALRASGETFDSIAANLGCSRSTVHNALSGKHGKRATRVVVTDLGERIDPKRFLAWVPFHLGLDECWPWQGRCQENGYGTYSGWKGAAHRVMFYLAHGRYPEGETRHMCHNRSCVNPLHLAEGTRSQNMLDRRNSFA